MNDKKIYDTVSGIDEELLDRSLARKTHGSPKKGFRWGVLAACLAMIVVLSSTAVTLLAAEAKEYNAALDFFAENGLPAEGLSRSDVKAVYRDITQKKFTCEKTEDVIRKAVPGLVIEHRSLTPKELADLWSKITSLKYPDLNKEGIFFDCDSVYDADGVYQKSTLRCRRFDELLWSAEFPGLCIEWYLYTEDGTVVWGYPHGDYTHSWIALVNNDGKTEWQNQPDHGFGREKISSVLPNEDGIIEVFGYTRGTDIADTDYLCLSRYDRSGKELYFRNTETVSRGVKKAAHLGDGYIVQNRGNDLLKLDKDGKLIDTVTFEADDCTYRITDMIEFSGRVYVSAYSTPKQDYELWDVIEYLRLKYYSKGIYDDVPGEEVTRLIQDNYTAVLLVCDPESITPQAFYSVKESLGGTLSVNGSNELEWEVENIVYAKDSPYTSSFTFSGISEIYVCTFDSDGTLVSETDSGRIAYFRR